MYLLIHGISRALYIHRAHVYVFMTCESRVLPRTLASVNPTNSKASPQFELCAPLILAVSTSLSGLKLPEYWEAFGD